MTIQAREFLDIGVGNIIKFSFDPKRLVAETLDMIEGMREEEAAYVCATIISWAWREGKRSIAHALLNALTKMVEDS